MRVLFLSRRYPFPLDRGDNRRVFHFIEGVARAAEVRVLCFGNGPELPLDGVAVRSVGARMGARRVLGPDALSVLAGNLGDRRSGLPLQVRASLDRRMTAALRDELDRFRPDVVHISPSTMAAHLVTIGGAAHTHVDLMDAYSVIMGQQALLARRGWERRVYAREAKLLQRFEAWVVQQSDSSSLASEADKQHAPGLQRALALPNGVSEADFPFSEPRSDSRALLFVGNYSWPPNVESVTRIANEVLPLVRDRLPFATLRVVGTAVGRAVAELADRPGVELIGQVPSVLPELHGAACVVAPMWSGAGIKTKILEAMSAGAPVVSNQLGMEGIVAARDGRHMLLAETPADLAEACVRLLEDPNERRRVADEAHLLVRGEYSWERQTRALLEAYADSARAGSRAASSQL